MPLTPEDVRNKRFSTVRFKEGYDEEEVDAFLDEVEGELHRLLSENTQLRSGAPAPQPPAEPEPEPEPEPAAQRPPQQSPAQVAGLAAGEEPSEAALRTLLLAQRTADEAIAQARSEADQIVATARGRAASFESEAQQQHAAAMSELQRQRSTLEAQIDQLRIFERDYRTRLKAYLEGQLRDLDARSIGPSGQPASASESAGRPAAPTPTTTQPVPTGPPAGSP